MCVLSQECLREEPEKEGLGRTGRMNAVEYKRTFKYLQEALIF
jgi:hypothetical protein